MATIKTKNSTTASDTPSSLAQGELAVNIADKKLFVGGSGGSSVVDLEFEKFNGGTITNDLTVENSEPTLFIHNTENSTSGDLVGKIEWQGQSGPQYQFDDIASIECKAAVTWQTTPFANLEFYCRAGTTPNLVARFEDDGQIYFPDVYYDTVSTSTRDLYIQSTGKIGYVSSIRDSKTNITGLTDVSWVYDLDPVSFNYRDVETIRAEDGTKSESYADTYNSELEYGLIAEDVETVNNELVFYNGSDLAGVHYKKLIVPMLKTIQDQKELIDALTTRVTALENA